MQPHLDNSLDAPDRLPNSFSAAINLLATSNDKQPRRTKRAVPHGLVVRIRRFHRRGPGSIPGVGTPPTFSTWFVRCKG